MIASIRSETNSALDPLGILRAMDAALHNLSQPLTSIACAMELIGRETNKQSSDVMLALAVQECSRAMQQVICSRELLAGALSFTKQHEKDMA